MSEETYDESVRAAEGLRGSMRVMGEINRRHIEYELQRDEAEGLSFPAASSRPDELVGWNETHYDVVWVTDPFRDESVPLDVGIAEDVQRLWAAGIKTHSSCQGGGDRQRFIMVDSKPRVIERARALLPWVRSTWDNKAGWTALQTGLSDDEMEFLLDTLFVYADVHERSVFSWRCSDPFGTDLCVQLDHLTVEVPKGTFTDVC